MPLPSVKSIVNTVSSFAADAYSNLTSNTDRSSLATATGKSSSPSSCAERTPSPTQVDSSRMSEGAKFHTRSVTRFLDEFEAEQRDKEAASEAPDLKNTLIARDTNAGNIKQPTLSSSHQSRPDRRSQERRILGLPEKSPTDAVIISPPMSRTPFLSRNQYRPQNTLDQPRSSKHEFYLNRTGKSTQHTSSNRLRQKSSEDFRENNHDQPLKKRKVQAAPVNNVSRREVIDLDEGESSTMASGQTVTTSSPVRSTAETTLPKGGLQRIPSKGFTVDIPKLQSPSRKRSSSHNSPLFSHHFVGRRSSSPDELSASDFVKNARKQRIGEDQEIMDQRFDGGDRQTTNRHDSILQSSSPEVSLPVVTPNHKKALKDSVLRQPTSRMERRLQTEDESPDALQNDATTELSHTHKTPRQQKAKQVNSPSKRQSLSKDQLKFIQRAKLAPSKHAHAPHQFSLASYACPGVPSSGDSTLSLDPVGKSLSLDFSDPLLNAGPIFKAPITNIARVEHSPQTEEARITIWIRKSGLFQKLGFEFASHNVKEEFVKTLTDTDSTIEFKIRQEKYFQGFFQNIAQNQVEGTLNPDDQRQQVRHSQDASLSASHSETLREGTKPKRRRLVDGLDAPRNRMKAELLPNTSTGQAQTTSDVEEPIDRAESSNAEVASKLNSSMASPKAQTLRRTTRSRATDKDDFDTEFRQEVRKPSIFGTLTRWKKPLVYPLTGKKRETVQFDDLQRLDEDEFLNDNLVSLFIRYLEEHAAKDMMKKVHFFNSFLFEALTKESKGRRGINFDAVRRWTVKVDLFSRDFVVVPVNENLHWFVMIICNLSYFKRIRELKEEEDDDEDEDEAAAAEEELNNDEDDIVEITQKTEKTQPEVILKSDLKQDLSEASARSSFAEMSLDDHALAMSSNLNPVKSVNGIRGRKKQPRRSLPKYAPDKPVIITLDSLDHARSSTASALKQYIVAEAKDKQNWDIDPNEIKGMTAKGIPHQNNFSDCGLYLCMYLEQFILQPYEFVRRILQRSNETRWPKQIASSNLRDRLRNMLMTLHNEQHTDTQRSTTIPPLGSIMVQIAPPEDDIDIDRLDSSTIRSARERYIRSKHSLQNRALSPEQEDLSAQEGRKMIESMDEWRNLTNDTILIEDDPQPQLTGLDGRRETPSKSPYFAHGDQAHIPGSHGIKLDSVAAGNDIAALTERIKRQRSPDTSHDGETWISAKSVEDLGMGLTSDSVDEAEVQEPVSLQSIPPRKDSTGKIGNRKAYQRFKKQLEDGDHDDIDEETPSARASDSFGQSRLASNSVPVELASPVPDMQSAVHGRRVLHDITAGAGETEQVKDITEDETNMLV